MAVQNFRDLRAWQKAMDLVENVYRETHEWPKMELYGLTSQVRRAVVSVPANIAEGQGRRGVREYLHHLSIAMGSLYEVETHLMIAHRLEYPRMEPCNALIAQVSEVARLLHGLTRSLNEAVTAG